MSVVIAKIPFYEQNDFIQLRAKLIKLGIKRELIMILKDLLFKSRSIRRFRESQRVSENELNDLIELTRLAPTGANRQPLKYILINEPVSSAILFPSTAWAGYLTDWDGPVEGERPSAYIIILGDTQISSGFQTDMGIAAQTIMLGAAEKGIAGCMIASIKKEKIRADFKIDPRYEILLVIALGYGIEKVVLEDVEGNDIKYWRDHKGVHHVPKRKLSDIIIEKRCK